MRASPIRTVLFGAGAGQAVLACALPVAARIFGSEEFGEFSILLSIALPVSILATGQLEHILPRLAASHRWLIVKFAVGGALSMSMLTYLVAMVVSGRTYAPIAPYLAFTVLTSGLLSIANYVLLSAGKYHAVAWHRIINGGVTAGLLLCAGTIAPSSSSALLAYAGGSAIASTVAIPQLKRMRTAHRPRKAALRELSDLNAWSFASRVLPANLLSNLALNLPVMGLGRLYGAEAAGAFFVARRLLTAPVQLVAGAIGEVSYAELARESRAKISDAFDRIRRGLAKGSLALGVVGLALAATLHIFLGDAYEGVGLIVLVLVPVAMAQAVSTATNRLLLIFGREGVLFEWNLSRVVSLTLLFLILLGSGVGFITGVVAFSILSVWQYSVLYRVTVRSV